MRRVRPQRGFGTTLGTLATSFDATAGSDKTAMTYWDTGWVHSSNDHVNPKVTYDYSPEGQQTSRIQDAWSDGARGRSEENWTYYPDGMLKEHSDRGSQKVIYSYDANNNLKAAFERAGIADPTRSRMRSRRSTALWRLSWSSRRQSSSATTVKTCTQRSYASCSRATPPRRAAT